MKIDRKKFWQNYHRSFDAYGPTTQATVNALNDILDRFEVEKRLKYRSWFAYSLATSFHETGIGGNHFVPVKEGRERADSPRRANQDRYWKTGFYGRGQIQTTHLENYRKLSRDLGQGDAFVQNPDLLLTPKWSYESLIHGMTKGIYRGDAKGRKNLARYLKGDDASLQDYVNARDIVNGDIKKNGLLIAGYAEKFEHILKDSVVAPASMSMSVNPASIEGEESSNTASSTSEAGTDLQNVPPPTPPEIPLPADVVSVPALSATPSESTPPPADEGVLTKIGNKANAAYTAFGAMISGAIAWFSGTPAAIVMYIMGTIVLLGIAYMIINAIRADRKESRDREDRRLADEREFKLKELREIHARDFTMYSMKSVAEKELNPVTIAAPPSTPLPNSDNPTGENV